MVALRRFFHTEKAPPSQVLGEQENSAHSSPQQTLPSRQTLKTPSSLHKTEHFQKIERQFEVMHEQLQSQPRSPRHIPLCRASSRLTKKSARHIDLLEALFSIHRHQRPPSGSPSSPISPYNEDIAERNMAPFLQGRQPHSQNVYSRSLSTLYQEDVADRNISRNNRKYSFSRSTTRLALSPSPQASSSPVRDDPRRRLRPKTRDGQIMETRSQETMRTTFNNHSNKPVPRLNDMPPPNNGVLRLQRSAPTILSENALTPQAPSEPDILSSEGRLGVPPAHKQGNRWSNTPLPDSPTLPMSRLEGSDSPNGREEQRDSHSGSTPSPRLRATSRERKPSTSPRSGSKKNVRDLSINTELASKGRPKKIAHRAIQPPTPSALEVKQNPSIAEIMNSPLPVATPTTPSPLLTSNQKVAEIMDMFRQACNQTAVITRHPTFETLQDAIVREINSHEAFQNLPVPTPGPPFTPCSFQDSFDKSMSAPKCSEPISGRDGQFSKLIRKTSMRRSRRGSERKSISTSVPSSVFRRAPDTPSRRRHTDAPPPSPGFFDTVEPRKDEQLTYMDFILRSEKPNEHRKPLPRRGHSHSVGALSSNNLSVTPSVLYMRAQSSASSLNRRTSPSVDDSDEEIIQLPSIGSIPRLHIQGVDGNNVSYIADHTTPRNAYRLMSWPRKSSRNLNLRSALIAGDSNTFRVPRNG